MAKLEVDQEHLLTVMSYGFKAQESRIALRQTNNIPEHAVMYLEEKEMLRTEGVERWRKEQQGKYLEVSLRIQSRASTWFSCLTVQYHRNRAGGISSKNKVIVFAGHKQDFV